MSTTSLLLPGPAAAAASTATATANVGVTLRTVHDAIRRRLVAVGQRVSSAYQAVVTDVADHVDAVGETLTNECDVSRDLGPEALSAVEMRRDEVDVLDALRASAPDVYADLVAAATRVWDAPPVGRRRLSQAEAGAWIARANAAAR